MEKGWRPKEWKNPWTSPADANLRRIFENGADAMFEALKKEEKTKAEDRRNALLCKLKANTITRDEAIELDEILATEEDAAKERGDTVAILTIGLGRALLASLLARTGKI